MDYRSVNEDDGEVDRALAFIRGDEPKPFADPHGFFASDPEQGDRPASPSWRIAGYAVLAAGVIAVVMMMTMGCGLRTESPEPPLAGVATVQCHECGGGGRVTSTCTCCKGAGKLEGSTHEWAVCVCCKGAGMDRNTCPVCRGSGRLIKTTDP
jgi:hypothetical protein